MMLMPHNFSGYSRTTCAFHSSGRFDVFEQLFPFPLALACQQSGPLAEERRRYLDHCAEQQRSRKTLLEIAIYTLIVAKALRLAERPGQCISRDEMEAAADRWSKRRRKPATLRNFRGSRLRFIRVATGWLTFLSRLQPPSRAPQPYAANVAQFASFMLKERGLSTCTVADSCRHVFSFLAKISTAGLRLKTLSVAHVDELLTQMVQDGRARVTVKNHASTLRVFFRYAEGRGWCRSGLASAIMAPRIYRHEGLPVGPSWDVVKQLLAASEGERRTDIRDRALLMLLVTYGLRAGEVTALRLVDFEWEREQLNVVHGKRHKPRTYPLCRSVGNAVLRYLREARPPSTLRKVFLTIRAPFRSLTPNSLGQVVSRRLHALNGSLPHYGPHGLRHACATHLLAQGLSLKEIGDHLGHQSPETTRIYAKVDLAGLRMVGDFDLEGLL
jgi:integrase/recombinase XerD